MTRIKQIKLKSRSNQFAKTYRNQGTEKTVHEKIWKFRNFRKIGGGEIFSQNDEEHSTDD